MKRNDLLVERIIAELDASLEQLGNWHEGFTHFQRKYLQLDKTYVDFCKEIKLFEKRLR
jgi:hypothetical protein